MAFRPRRREMPGGLWLRCADCEKTVYRKDVEEGLNVCPECNCHFPIPADQRISITLDEGSFRELHGDLVSGDPLRFVDKQPYPERIKRFQEQTGLKDAAVVGRGTIEGRPLFLGVIDSRFMMGSMGSVVGEKITRIIESAGDEGLPCVIVSGAGGGARMQEGVLSLMQMAKTSAALRRYAERRGLFISVLTHPTMGGTMASFAALGDIVIAEPKALIGFTGPRVIEETIKEKLPEGFQTAEFALEHGLIDMIVPRPELKATLARLLDYSAQPS